VSADRDIALETLLIQTPRKGKKEILIDLFLTQKTERLVQHIF